MAKYLSKYSTGQSSAAQYITQIICEHKATEDLPQYFWRLPKWASFYRQQIISANSLLRIYSAAAIIRALELPIARSIYSLRAPHLDALIKAEESKLQQAMTNAERAEKIERADITAKPRQAQPIQTNLSKLKELDG